MIETVLIAVRIVAGPLASLHQKNLMRQGFDPVLLPVLIHAGLGSVMLPYLVLTCAPCISAHLAGVLAVTMLFEIAGNVLMMYSLRITDLSLFGPVNSWKPLVSLLLGVLVLGEVPGLTGLAGVGLILGGSWLLAGHAEENGRSG